MPLPSLLRRHVIVFFEKASLPRFAIITMMLLRHFAADYFSPLRHYATVATADITALFRRRRLAPFSSRFFAAACHYADIYALSLLLLPP